MRLYLLECKKIMTSRFHLILLLLFMILPMVIFQNMIADTDNRSNPYLHADGSRMSTAEIQEEKHRVKLTWTGTMDAAWWNRLQTAYKAAEKRIDTHIYDMEKMAGTGMRIIKAIKRHMPMRRIQRKQRAESGFCICVRYFSPIIRRILQTRLSVCCI